MIHALKKMVKPWEIHYQTNLAACLCVGNNFTRQSLNLAYAVINLLGERIPVINHGFSDLGMVLAVRKEDGERALRCLHRDFVLPATSTDDQTYIGEDQTEIIC